MNAPSAEMGHQERGAERFEARLESVLHELPREAFIEPGEELPIPQRLARRLLRELSPGPEARLLHVGTGRGYMSALCSRLVRSVHSVDKLVPSLKRARETTNRLGLTNIDFQLAAGSDGLVSEAPYDAIIVTARSVGASPALKQQLRVGGRMLLCQGDSRQRPRLTRIVRLGRNDYESQDLGALQFESTIADMLVEMELLTPEQSSELTAEVDLSGDNLDARLLSKARISEAEFYTALSRQRGLRLSSVEAMPAEPDWQLLKHMSREFLLHHRVLPLSIEGPSAKVVSCNPSAELSGVAGALGVSKVELILVTPTDFHRLWARLDLHDRSRREACPASGEFAEFAAELGDGELAHAVQMFRALMLEAVGSRASDLHIEQFEERLQIRLRIDGELHQLDRIQINRADCAALVNVIKVRSQLDIAEKRRPQGGRMSVQIHGQHYDLRVQVQPCLHGEHVVIRILARDAVRPDISELGFDEGLARGFRRMLQSPGGMLLVVGPTGSGKSTTLYAGLAELAADQSRKVITAEDPVEYSMNGVQQTEIRPEVGFCFADAMRSFVRQDPDVILVGEIRDGETALEAVRASQTGHLVLSTLHCNDSLDAVQRLHDLGMHANSVACELLGVVAQRLAKRVCEHCRKPAKAPAWLLEELYAGQAPKDFVCFAGEGCPHCDHRGTVGRVAVGELLRITPKLRHAIVHGATPDELRAIAVQSGMMTMREHALQLVHEGIIPVTELPRVLPQERLLPMKPAVRSA